MRIVQAGNLSKSPDFEDSAVFQLFAARTLLMTATDEADAPKLMPITVCVLALIARE